jgi:hypothetical protein
MDSDGDTNVLERIEQLIGRVPENGGWDRGFVESVKEQIENGRTLSPRQLAIVGKIEGRFSDDALAHRATWEKDWNAEKQKRFNIAVKYYGRSGYYQNIVQRAWGEENFVPTRKEYNAIVCNKYATAVIGNALADAKYPLGGLVQFRKAARVRSPYRGKLAVVVEHGDTVKTHAKGGKPYGVVLIGDSKVIQCEERDLKNAPKKVKRTK